MCIQQTAQQANVADAQDSAVGGVGCATVSQPDGEGYVGAANLQRYMAWRFTDEFDLIRGIMLCFILK